MSEKSYDPAWQEKYASMIATAGEAAARLGPGQRVFIGTGCAEPLELVRALTERSRELPDTEIVHLLTFGEAPYTHEELTRYFRVNSFFIAENVRHVIQEGLGDYTPIFLSDIPRLFRSGRLPLDVALIQVTPPDANGMCSLGVSVDIVKSAAENAALVIAQVNTEMPRTLGDSFLHVYDLDVLVPTGEPILEAPYAEVTTQTRQIAEYVSALIEDGSTLELGIGAIPHALLGHGIGKFLFSHLVKIARRGGIRGFTAEVLCENKGMQAVFNRSECKTRSRMSGNVYSYEMDFD